MIYRTRNVRYLRVSAQTVLPLYLYLDERHVDWMSDRILHNILTDLRPLILPKLREEADAHLGPGPAPAGAKRGTVDTLRRDTYQFAYFFRKTERHSIVIKSRNFELPPSRTRDATAVDPPPVKQPIRNTAPRNLTLRPRKRKTREQNDSSDEERFSSGSQSEYEDGQEEQDYIDTDALSRSRRPHKRSRKAGATTDVDEGTNEDPPPLPISEEDQEEPKPKPILNMNFCAHGIYGRCLCIVVEPYPPLPSAATASRASSVIPSFENDRAESQARSIAPPDYVPDTLQRPGRAETPLFLPDPDRRSVTPMPSVRRNYPPVPLFNEAAPIEEDHDDDGIQGNTLLQFTQLLSFTSGGGFGGDGEDDELDGAVLFGDADERREL